MDYEGRNFVGRVGRRKRIAPQGMAAGAGNSLDFEGTVIDLGSADRTAEHYDLVGTRLSRVAVSVETNRIDR